MIICPNCKEEIEERSHYCDQCGHALLYCDRCGHVGIGRRCTSCGGLMVSPVDSQRGVQTSYSSQTAYASQEASMATSGRVSSISQIPMGVSRSGARSFKNLRLSNTSLNIFIEGLDGAVIGRRQGPYTQYFQNNMYVSGVHAQLHCKAGSGWYIVDKHSSNGTKLNNRPLQPDVEMLLSDGDIVMIANVNLEVSIK